MKFCIIGLGRFGMQVAKSLAENGMEVMAVDSNEAIVASIRDNVTQAICMRVTDEASLRSIGIDEMDTAIIAIGENFAQSILITALLKKRLHIPTVIARATSDIHKEILAIVGADRVVLPEKEIGIELADKLSLPFADLIRLAKNFSGTPITAPKAFVGKSLKTLKVFKQYKVYCVGLQQNDTITTIMPDHVIAKGEKLFFVGDNVDLEEIIKL